MGQAFDRDGHVLGEVEAATKREVFEELNAKFPLAHEIRIKSLKDRLGQEREQTAQEAIDAKARAEAALEAATRPRDPGGE